MKVASSVMVLSSLALAGSAFAQPYDAASGDGMGTFRSPNATTADNDIPGLPDTGGGWGANR